MNLVVTLDFRFVRTPDGQVWTRTTYPYSFWERYLKVFERVQVVARAEMKESVDEHYRAVMGPGVQFHAVPYYLGAWQYLKVRRRVQKFLRTVIAPEAAVLCRVGSRLAEDFLPLLWKSGRPYGLEVVGDPYEAFAPRAIKHPLRPYLRRHATRALKEQCARAAAVSYVTQQALQRRYPCGSKFAVGVSDTDLQPDWFSSLPRGFVTSDCITELRAEDCTWGPKQFTSASRPRLLFVGSLEQMYKGQDILLRAVAQVQKKIPVELRIVGAGRHRQELESLAESLSLGDSVHFTGELSSGAAIQSELDGATLMVLPSRTEGLPRVIVEAMARALPCIASNVGGIPELLDAEDLVPPGDADALATKIEEVLRSPSRLNRMSVRNLAKAQQFRPEVLEKRRTEFYRFLRDTTETWLHSQSSGEIKIA